MLIEPEPLCLVNSISMTQDVWPTVDGGLSAF